MGGTKMPTEVIDFPEPKIVKCFSGEGYDLIAPEGFVFDLPYPHHNEKFHIYLKKV